MTTLYTICKHRLVVLTTEACVCIYSECSTALSQMSNLCLSLPDQNLSPPIWAVQVIPPYFRHCYMGRLYIIEMILRTLCVYALQQHTAATEEHMYTKQVSCNHKFIQHLLKAVPILPCLCWLHLTMYNGFKCVLGAFHWQWRLVDVSPKVPLAMGISYVANTKHNNTHSTRNLNLRNDPANFAQVRITS